MGAGRVGWGQEGTCFGKKAGNCRVTLCSYHIYYDMLFYCTYILYIHIHSIIMYIQGLLAGGGQGVEKGNTLGFSRDVLRCPEMRIGVEHGGLGNTLHHNHRTLGLKQRLKMRTQD